MGLLKSTLRLQGHMLRKIFKGKIDLFNCNSRVEICYVNVSQKNLGVETRMTTCMSCEAYKYKIRRTANQ